MYNLLELTSGTQEAPAHVDRGGEEAIPLGAAVTAADHDVMGEDDAACGHTAVSCVIGHWTADTMHQTAFTGTRGEGKRTRYTYSFCQLFTNQSCGCTVQHAQSCVKMLIFNYK